MVGASQLSLPFSYSHTPSNRHRSRSSISDQITALPSSSKASLERIRERSVEPSPPAIRRLSDPNVQDPLAPLPNAATELKNPIKDPNWPDTAFTKPVSETRHLASEVQDQIEKWVCGNVECEKPNQKHLKKCEWCGWKLPVAFYVDANGKPWNEENIMRQMGGGEDCVTEEERPTGQAPGGGVWIPQVPGQEKKERQPNVF